MVTGRPKFFMPSLLSILCLLVCVGTWVLILNLYSGGKERGGPLFQTCFPELEIVFTKEGSSNC